MVHVTAPKYRELLPQPYHAPRQAKATNFPAGRLEILTMAGVQDGAIPKLVALLARGGEGAEEAARTLRRMSLEGPATRELVLAHAVPAMLLHMHQDAPLDLLRLTVQTYSNLCRCDGILVELKLVSPALPYIYRLLNYGDQDVQEAACTALLNLMHGPSDRVEAVQAVPGMTMRLVVQLGHEAIDVRAAALGAVANMLAGTNAQVDQCIQANCLEHIAGFLQCPEPHIVARAARAVGNIFAHTHAQIEKTLFAGKKKDILSLIQEILINGETECKKQAAQAISNLCYFGSVAHREHLVWSGVLEPYCALLSAPDPTLVMLVLAGLDVLLQATIEDKKENRLKYLCLKLSAVGGVLDQTQPLLQRHAVDEDLRNKAVELSVKIRRHARDELLIIEDGKVYTPADIVQELKSQDLMVQTTAARAADRMLREQDASTTTMVYAGVIPPLVRALMNDSCSDLQYAATGALSSIILVQSHRKAVVDCGALPKLVKLVSRGGEIAVRAVSALGTIASHKQDMTLRDLVLDHGVIQAMLPHMRLFTPLQLLKTCVHTYSHFCSNIGEKFELLLPALPLISELLTIGEERRAHDTLEVQQILEDACDAILALMMRNECDCHERIAVTQRVSGLTARLVALLGHEKSKSKDTALGIIGIMLSGPSTQIASCLDAGCLNHIMVFLQRQRSEVSLISWALQATYRIFAGTHDQIQRALDKDILTPLRNILTSGNPECRIEAASAVANLCRHASAEQHKRIVWSGVLLPYCELLAAPDVLDSTVRTVLDGLVELIKASKTDSKDVNIVLSKLKAIGVPNKIQKFRWSEDVMIRKMTNELFQTLKQHP